jgi:hypothetical protein
MLETIVVGVGLYGLPATASRGKQASKPSLHRWAFGETKHQQAMMQRCALSASDVGSPTRR